MKYSLKNEYKELLKEFRVSIETDEGYYDYEFDDTQSVDFKNLKFINKSDNKTEYSSDFKKEIVKTPDYTSYDNPTRSNPAGETSFTLDKNTGSLLQYLVLKAIKNIVIYENQAYGELCEGYDTSIKHNVGESAVVKFMLKAILDFLNKKYNESNENLYIKTLDAAINAINKKEGNNSYNNKNILEIVANPIERSGVLDSLIKSGKSKVSTALLKYFKRDFTDINRNKTASIQHTIIANEYMANGPDALSLFYRGKSDYNNKNQPNIRIRREVKSVEDVENILRQTNSVEIFKKINLKAAANRKGKGEFLCHMLFNTSNACLPIEPDVVIPNVGSFSVKSMASASARTGENIDQNIKKAMENLFRMLKSNYSYSSTQITKSDLEDFVMNRDEKEDLDKIKDAYNKLKIEIITEHDAEGLILHSKDGNLSVVLKNNINTDHIHLSEFKNNRWAFTYSKSESKNISYENVLRNINQSANEPAALENSSYMPQGKVLKEIYPSLFKKKLISEGGLAGHMMHPYEALDMTPRQIIDRIKEYSTSQKIIEKVDGQNLFFTVEQDGTLMFARNKEDMTHNDLVAKFTGHGAEKPFVEGGNAIKRGVEQWLQSAGPAAEMEIREIFHPDGETKSFINFEIMHPDKPNQIIYDEKYIVFHSIVDYIDGRKTVYSTNKGQRLEKIIRLMDSGITSAGFTLASNRTVNLNKLASVQIEDYVERVKEVALSLGISEDITLGEGIENIIKQEIEGLGINLDRETLKKIYDFVLYGEDRQGNKIKSRDFTSSLVKSDAAGLRSLNLTNAQEALKKVQRIISPFKDVFVDLGIDLLKGVKSAYMSDETNQKNIELLRDKLQTAINDLTDYMNEKPENYWDPEVHRLRTHLDKVIDKDITDIVATTVEGGVYDYQGDLLKVTGGFAPLNQILGAAYRDKKGIFPTFKQKFMQQESNRRSLKDVFNLIF